MRHRRAITVLCTGGLLLATAIAQEPASPPANDAPTPALKPADAAVRTVVLTVTATVAVPADGEHQVALWLARPMIDDTQRIVDVSVPAVEGLDIARTTDPQTGNTFLCFSAESRHAPVEVSATWTIERREALRARFRGVGRQPLSDDDRVRLARHLAPNRLVPTAGRVKTRADALARGENNTVNIARALFDDVRRTLKYQAAGPGCGNGDTLWACDAGHGDSADAASLFISMARARGIPARFIAGIPLPETRTTADAPVAVSAHVCWTEFFVSGTGWIPVDFAAAATNPDLAQYAFGNLTEDRIAFTEGRDLTLLPASAGDPHNFFIHPYAEVDQKTAAVSHTFTIKDVQP